MLGSCGVCGSRVLGPVTSGASGRCLTWRLSCSACALWVVCRRRTGGLCVPGAPGPRGGGGGGAMLRPLGESVGRVTCGFLRPTTLPPPPPPPHTHTS